MLSEQITDGFEVNARANEITFRRFSDVQREGQSFFFNLPPRFRGNQVNNTCTHFATMTNALSLEGGMFQYLFAVQYLSEEKV